MRSNGNDMKSLLRKLYFFCLPTQQKRTKYIYKHQHLFRGIGDKLLFQPRHFPQNPEYIKIGTNVKISANVEFTNHDIIGIMLNDKYECDRFKPYAGCIEIGDNVMIGANVHILPNVKIGSDVIIGAGAVVAKDIPDKSIVGGVPARRIGDFDDLVKKREALTVCRRDSDDDIWASFFKQRQE